MRFYSHSAPHPVWPFMPVGASTDKDCLPKSMS
jgi:hypothetical protein